ncbi:hypothetical protein SSU98_1844 [Streptococcus suis 98HAH33]|nr:hypothetical protein SSU98_1844 [Streptococcus suis 98HAH33]
MDKIYSLTQCKLFNSTKGKISGWVSDSKIRFKPGIIAWYG